MKASIVVQLCPQCRVGPWVGHLPCKHCGFSAKHEWVELSTPDDMATPVRVWACKQCGFVAWSTIMLTNFHEQGACPKPSVQT